MDTVLIINKGNSDNLGDQAINYGLLKFYKKIGYSIEFYDLTFRK